MKRLIYILLGVVSGGVTTYLITLATGYLIEPYYRPSGEYEMTRNFMIFIVIFIVLSIAGGFIANIVYKRTLTKR